MARSSKLISSKLNTGKLNFLTKFFHSLSKKINTSLMSMSQRTSSNIDLYDCIMFYKEYDLLEIRLNELDDVVEKFIIVEATETFQGDQKPLFLKENLSDFSEFKHKIVYEAIEYPEKLNDPWEREYYLRNSIQTVVENKTSISSQDQIMISDVDEIPSATSVESALELSGIKLFRQSLHYYCYNYVVDDKSNWFGPVMLSYNDLTSCQDVRDRYCLHQTDRSDLGKLSIELSINNRKLVYIMPDGGWHFSYLGDTDFIIDKIESFSHTEYNKSEYKNRDEIRERIKTGEDIFNRNISFKTVDIDSSFPSYLQRNQTEFKQNIAQK